MKRISKSELEIIFNLILNKLYLDKIDQIVFDMDKYWIITTDEWNKFGEIPQPAVGSLEEDIKYLKNAIEQNEIVSYVDFDRLASILRAISETEAPIL